MTFALTALILVSLAIATAAAVAHVQRTLRGLEIPLTGYF